MNEKVVVITGASAGIGAAVAELLASRGMVLGCFGCPAQGRAASGWPSDAADMLISSSPSDRARRGASGRGGGACAARTHRRLGQQRRPGISCPPSEFTDEDIDEVMRVNVKSALYGMQEVLPHFKARNDGHVINISSMLGRIPFAVIRSAYRGAKHFLNALTVFREEVQKTHPAIQFSLVSPGVVRTDFGFNARHGGPDSRAFPESQSERRSPLVIAGVVAYAGRTSTRARDRKPEWRATTPRSASIRKRNRCVPQSIRTPNPDEQHAGGQ